MQPGGSYLDDMGATITDTSLRNLAAAHPLTFTCAVPGSGQRMAIDRDEDTVLDGNDNCAALDNLDQLNFDGDSEGDACDADDDNDQLSDEQELLLGTLVLNPDTDGDGFSDGIEVEQGSDPLDAASTPESISVPLLPWVGALLLMLLTATLRFNRQAA